MSSAGPIGDIVGGGLKAFSSLQQGEAAFQSGEYNAQIENYNASEIMREGKIAVAQQKRQALQTIGRARVQYAANGIATDQGSALDVLQSGAANAAYDALNLQHSYDVKAYGHTASALMDQYEGNQARQGSYYTAAGQLLSGLGSAAASSKPKAKARNNGIDYSPESGQDFNFDTGDIA